MYTKLQEEKGTAILVKFTEVLKPMTNLYLTATTTDSVSMLATFIPLILMIVIFYFLLIRPQKKRDKEVQKMRENIEIADEIVTIGGRCYRDSERPQQDPHGALVHPAEHHRHRESCPGAAGEEGREIKFSQQLGKFAFQNE